MQFKLVHLDVVGASDDTEYTFTIPDGAKNLLIRPSSSAVAWRWSHKTGVVAVPGGMNMSAGESLSDQGVAHLKQTFYWGHTAGVSVTLQVSFLVPVGR